MEKCYFKQSYRLKAYNYTKSNTPSWVFFTFLKLKKCYQIVQNITGLKFANLNLTRKLATHKKKKIMSWLAYDKITKQQANKLIFAWICFCKSSDHHCKN